GVAAAAAALRDPGDPEAGTAQPQAPGARQPRRGIGMDRRRFIAAAAATLLGRHAVRGPAAAFAGAARLAGVGAGGGMRAPASAAGAPSSSSLRPVPTPSQLLWQRDELALFVHFGINTFTDREWGDGREDPALFAPAALDARQWARAARAAGFRAMVLTAKQHDGFCLWPTA